MLLGRQHDTQRPPHGNTKKSGTSTSCKVIDNRLHARMRTRKGKDRRFARAKSPTQYDLRNHWWVCAVEPSHAIQRFDGHILRPFGTNFSRNRFRDKDPFNETVQQV